MTTGSCLSELPGFIVVCRHDNGVVLEEEQLVDVTVLFIQVFVPLPKRFKLKQTGNNYSLSVKDKYN